MYISKYQCERGKGRSRGVGNEGGGGGMEVGNEGGGGARGWGIMLMGRSMPASTHSRTRYC